MLGSLLGPLGHLLFDHARIEAVAARFRPFLPEFPKQGFRPLRKGSWRAAAALREAALHDVKTPGEREAIGIEPLPLGGLEHQGANYEMPQRQRIQLLNHAGRGFTAEVGGLGRPTRILVRLLLVVDQFVFPSLVVSGNQLHRRRKPLVQEVGKQGGLFAVADRLRIVNRVLDHPHDDPGAVFRSGISVGINLGQVVLLR